MRFDRHIVLSEYDLDFPRERERALCGKEIPDPLPCVMWSEFLEGAPIHLGTMRGLCHRCLVALEDRHETEKEYLYILMADQDVRELEARGEPIEEVVA